MAPETGYRIAKFLGRDRSPTNNPDALVFLAFSGGGTRAAALSYGVVEELWRTSIVVKGHQHSLLDEVDLIAGVSGGSFTALAYALCGERLFHEALDRLHELADGRFAYRLRHAWSDGTETLIFEPGTLIEKLVALVPRPNGHLTRFYGVLAPRASWRAAIVPRPAGRDEVAQSGAGQGRGQRAGTWPSWATLLARVFAVDILECPGCGSRRQVIAVVMDPSVVRAILQARGLPAEPPARSPARPPPQPVFDFPDGA